MSIKVQNAPDPAIVGWHRTADGGQGYWNGVAWTVTLGAPGAQPTTEPDTPSALSTAAVRAHGGAGATVLPAHSHAATPVGRDRPGLAQLVRRLAGSAAS